MQATSERPGKAPTGNACSATFKELVAEGFDLCPVTRMLLQVGCLVLLKLL
jgi:hypothetical protein